MMISNCKTVEIVGVGTTASRNNSTYNGCMFQTVVLQSKRMLTVGPEELAFSSLINIGSNPGVFVAGGTQPMLYTTGDGIN